MKSIESESAIKKLLRLGRLPKEPKMSPAVKSLSIQLLMLSSGGKPTCPPCCMVRSFSHLLLTSLLRLERCQSWFLKNIFHFPKFAPVPLFQKLSGMKSIESESAIKKLLRLGRLPKEPKMSPAVKSLFDSRTKSFFDSNITSLGMLPSVEWHCKI